MLDVREIGEMPVVKLRNLIQVPLSVLELESEKLDIEKEFLIFCQSGLRSRKAAELLSKKGFRNLKLVQGGAKDLLQLQTDEIKGD